MMNLINIGIITLLICYGALLGITGNSKFTVWKMDQYTEQSVRILNHLLGAGFILFAIGIAMASIGLRNYGDAQNLLLLCGGVFISWLAIAADITLFVIVPKKRKG